MTTITAELVTGRSRIDRHVKPELCELAKCVSMVSHVCGSQEQCWSLTHCESLVGSVQLNMINYLMMCKERKNIIKSSKNRRFVNLNA